MLQPKAKGKPANFGEKIEMAPVALVLEELGRITSARTDGEAAGRFRRTHS
jgi:hypothetical protein